MVKIKLYSKRTLLDDDSYLQGSPIMGQQKVRLCRSLTRCHFTVGHTEVPSLERFVFSPVSEHYQDVKESILKIKTQRIFILARRGKSLSAKDLREGLRDGDRVGRVRVRGHRDPGEGFRVESSFTISVLGAVARGRGFLESLRQGPGDRHWCSGSGGVRGLGGGQGAGGHGTAGAQNPVPLGAGAEGGDGESGSRGTVWHKSQRGTGRERDTTHPYLGTRGGEVWQGREWQSPGAGLERGSGTRPGPGARPMGQGCSDRGCGAPGRVHAEVLGEAGVRRRCLGHERLVGRRRAIPAWVGRLGEPRGRGRGGRARLGHGHHAAPRGHRRRHRCLLHLLPGLGGGSGSDAVLDPRRGRCSPEGPSPSPR